MNVTRELEVMECAHCFVCFAAPKRLIDAKRKNGSDFFCPNGHSLSYHDNENAQLRRERDRLKQKLAEKDDELRAVINQRNVETKKLATLQKRSAAGVCQCCHRTFAQLARHMATKHPEFKAVQVVA